MPVSEWTEDRAEAVRWVAALKKTVGFYAARLIIVSHESYGRTYYRVEKVI